MIEKREKDVMLKKWEGTSFESENEFLIRANKIGYTYLLIGREVCPSTGRLHLQFYIETKNRIRVSTIGNKKHLGCAVFPLRRPTEEAINYIIANPEKPNPHFVEFGVRPIQHSVGQCKNSQAASKKELNKEILRLAREGKFDTIADEHPGIYLRSYVVLKKIWSDAIPRPYKESIQCIRLLGKSGQGKTQFVHTWLEPLKEVYFHNKKRDFVERYNLEPMIIFDDLDLSQKFLLNEMKTWCDTRAELLNCKFGSVWSYATKIFVTSQYNWKQLIGITNGKCHDEELLEALDRRFTTLIIVSMEPNFDLMVRFNYDTKVFSLRLYLISINFI